MTRREILCLLGLCFACSGSSVKANDQAISDALRGAFETAGNNKSELLSARGQLAGDPLESFAFLVVNMPERDLTALKADFLVTNITLAHRVMREVPWGSDVPKEIFRNYILPYANVSEKRDNWREQFYKDFLPLVKDCRGIAKAAETLNRTIFKQLKVKYSRKRRAPDQGPFETIETGLASCTGLSILLIDACRAVGIPARLAGTPLWFDRSGNHTWVEMWDQGWHFMGAAEPGKLNQTWFVGKAAKAKKGHSHHAIYAVSYAKTDLHFPMVWARRARYVHAVDNTDMYLPKAAVTEETAQLAIRVLDRPGGTRIEALVQLIDPTGKVLAQGTSKGPEADMNHHLTLPLPKQVPFGIQITQGPRQIRRRLTSEQCKGRVLEFFLNEAKPPRGPKSAQRQQGKDARD